MKLSFAAEMEQLKAAARRAAPQALAPHAPPAGSTGPSAGRSTTGHTPEVPPPTMEAGAGDDPTTEPRDAAIEVAVVMAPVVLQEAALVVAARGSSSSSMPLREVVDLKSSPADAEEERAGAAPRAVFENQSLALDGATIARTSAHALLPRHMALLASWGHGHVPEEVNEMLSLHPDLLAPWCRCKSRALLGLSPSATFWPI
ncbi:uncharacterized protein LOC131246601 [Magnolia sinica]|uniref:uncharacterized protein LOC131246601 n=1 Tax=Magnolia sinica TaxID=86752 RepID=UPI00265B0CE3|nr:uncharacterized protein LOC131246601 [Magnolia sinica]